MTGPDRPAVETGTTSPANTCPAKTRWLYPTLAVTGIAVGIFVVAAGLFLLFAPAGGTSPRTTVVHPWKPS